MKNFETAIIPDGDDLNSKFRELDSLDFISLLREYCKANPANTVEIVTDWPGVQKARFAKDLMDHYASRYNIKSIIIRATREQYEECVNAFESGVKWEEAWR